MRIKLLFVIDSLNSGGAERSLVSLLNTLPRDRYDIDLYLTSKVGLYLPLVPDYICIKQIKFLEGKLLAKLFLFMFSIYLRIGKLLSYFGFKSKLHGAQKNWLFNKHYYEAIDGEFDVAFAYSQGFPTYFVSQKVKARRKLAWINTDYRLARYNSGFDKKFYANFDTINLVSPEAAEIFKTIFPKFSLKTIVIRDIISSKMILKMSKDESRILIANPILKILTVGRIVDVKGYDLAIEAAYILKERGFDFIWMVIGEGPLEKRMKQLVVELKLENHFKFLGTFINPFPIFKQCDIYCQTSRFEGYGMAIAEAKILNKPVVSTNFEVVHDQLKNRYNGLIVSKNGQAIADGILELNDNLVLRNDIVNNIKREEKGTEKEIEKILDLIEG
jgi:glycosyltransferase involved in cell wall biosynthesis